MNTRQRPGAGRITIVALVLCLGGLPVVARSRPDPLAGRRLEDAIPLLQARGLRVVFTSELADSRPAGPDRTTCDARSRAARRVGPPPHGLEPEAAASGGIIQVVRRRPTPAERSRWPMPQGLSKAADADRGTGGVPPGYRERCDRHRGAARSR